MGALVDQQWSVLEPLLNEARPWAARAIRQFRRTIEAIVWRQQNGAKWRSIPAGLGPWWMAAQTFIRWARLGVWERVHRLAQKHRGLKLGMVFLDGTVIRAHQKAAGACKQHLTPEASAEAQALGRSRGGYGTKGHVLADAKQPCIGQNMFGLGVPGSGHRRPDGWRHRAGRRRRTSGAPGSGT